VDTLLVLTLSLHELLLFDHLDDSDKISIVYGFCLEEDTFRPTCIDYLVVQMAVSMILPTIFFRKT
jgi:hypothetical protein